MGPNQFLALMTCLLCLGLSTVFVNQAALDDGPSPAFRATELPTAAPAPVRL